MKTVKMTVGELKHLVTEGGSMSPTMHMKSGAASRLDNVAAKMASVEPGIDANVLARDIERVYVELEPRSPSALKRDYIEATGDDPEMFGPKFWERAFKALKADEKARSQRSSYEF